MWEGWEVGGGRGWVADRDEGAAGVRDNAVELGAGISIANISLGDPSVELIPGVLNDGKMSMVPILLNLSSLCAVLEIEDGLVPSVGELGFDRGVVWQGAAGGGVAGRARHHGKHGGMGNRHWPREM